MWHVREIGEAHKEFWWGDLKKEDILEDLGLERKIIF
jgi:hypothetical protein